MNTYRWNPVLDFARLQDEVTRLLDGTLGVRTEASSWTPAADVFEDAEGITFKFDLPEVDPKDVDVRLENGVLMVRGERKLEREDQKDSYRRVERAHGAFARSFTLPTTFDAEKVTAESKNGVLRIFVPKRAEAKPKTVTVQVS